MLKKLTALVCASCLQGCVQTPSEATEATALLIVAIPVGVVTAPIWIPSAIVGANRAQIKKGSSKSEIISLLGKPEETYECDNGFSLMEYKPELIIKGGQYLIFDDQEKFFETTRNPSGCQPDNSFELTPQSGAAQFNR